MEDNRWTDGLTVEFPKAEKLAKDGIRLALKAVASRTPIDKISLGREDESDKEREVVRNGARQEAARIFGLQIPETPEEEVDTGSPQVRVERAQGDRTVTVLPDQVELTTEQIERAVSLLRSRFEDQRNKDLCPTLSWEKAERALRATPNALETVLKAEEAGHEPTICFSDETGFILATRSNETPQSTRNCVYDEEAEQWRKENYPDERFNGNAVSQAREMGWDIQEAEMAKHIAEKTPSYKEEGISWFKTDLETRISGDALDGFRYGACVYVFPAYAGAHDAGRGWRGSLRVLYKKA